MARPNLRLIGGSYRESRGAPPPTLPPGDDGGTYDGMEARVAKLEAHVEHIQGDIRDLKDGVNGLRADLKTEFRLLFGALIATALGLAGIMAKGFGWL